MRVQSFFMTLSQAFPGKTKKTAVLFFFENRADQFRCIIFGFASELGALSNGVAQTASKALKHTKYSKLIFHCVPCENSAEVYLENLKI